MVFDSIIDDEIDEIRRELIKLAGSTVATSLSSSVTSIDRTAVSLEAGGEGDVNMQHLMGASAQRYDKLAGATNEKKELERLERERDELREWLRRGVAECRRVADDAQQRKKELEESTRRCLSIEAEKEAMESKIAATQRQLVETQAQLQQLEEKARLLGASAEERALMLKQLEEMHAQQEKEHEILLTEADFLRRRVGKIEEVEMHLQLLTERLQQLQAHIERLGCVLREGNIEDVSAEEFFLGECAAEPQQPLSELVTRVKVILRSLPDAVRQLQCDINAFVTEQRIMRSEQEKTHRAQIEATHLAKLAELHRYEVEREAMLQAISRLRAEFVRHITNCTECDEEDVEQQANCIATFYSLEKSNNQLTEENDKLREENELLQKKLRRLKIDWKKVHESQLRFQDLQLRVDMILQANEKLRVENNSLKLLLETGFQKEDCQQEPQQIEQRQLSEISKEPTCRKNVLDRSNGKRCTQKGPISFWETSQHSTERELFQEWKNMVIDTSFY